jgi:hypothetical protein
MDLFHVSEEDLGPSIKLYPRVPLRRGPAEDFVTSRICVAPTVVSCLRMVSWTDGVDDFNVYRLLTPVSKVGLVNPTKSEVPDLERSGRHKELWLTRASSFEWLGKVRMVRPNLVTGRPCFWWEAKNIPFQKPHNSEMTQEQVRQHLALEAEIRRVQTEMEAEIRASGGKMVSDLFKGAS